MKNDTKLGVNGERVAFDGIIATSSCNSLGEKMGRSILISDNDGGGDVGFGYNTLVFDVISEGARLKFRPEDHDCLKKCYEDLDENDLEYICLYDLDVRCFNAFRRACEDGFRELNETRDVVIDYIASNQEVTGFVALWGELIDALRRDSRNVED